MRLVSRSGLIATTLATAAIAAPNAEAGLFSSGPDPQGAAQQEAQGFLRIYSHAADGTAPVQAPSSSTSSNGFNYGDAAVGAGVIGGLVLLGTGGTLAVRRRAQLRHS